MPLPAPIRAFYLQAGPMTALGRHAAAAGALAGDPAGVAAVVQGLMVHFHWAQRYAVELTPKRIEEQHLRPAEVMLDVVLANLDRPLGARRDASDRVVGVCRHFSVLSTAILRAHGVPARCRVGFGAYFNPGTFEDHWVVEYWDDAQDRWLLVDSQIDALQAGVLKPDFDVLDVPRDRFIIAGDAWRRCRSGAADPAAFGIFDMRGLWFVAGNVLRDVASLNNMEMLPWDVWGADPDVGAATLTAAQLALFDRLAGLTLDADDRFGELRQTYENDPSLRVPDAVFNAVANRTDQLVPAPAPA
jgi:Transglutaminase-like superfamily